MTPVTVSNKLEAPVEQVFAAFTDIEHNAGRVSGIKNVEMLTTGGFRLGARWRETREILGRLDDAEMEITAFESGRGYTITHYKGGAKIDTVFTFAPDGEGTQVSITFALENQGLPPGLLSPVSWAIAGKVKEALSKDLSDMKKAVEQ
jgi:carbon monoxide dehydrogenase subunit G